MRVPAPPCFKVQGLGLRVWGLGFWLGVTGQELEQSLFGCL